MQENLKNLSRLANSKLPFRQWLEEYATHSTAIYDELARLQVKLLLNFNLLNMIPYFWFRKRVYEPAEKIIGAIRQHIAVLFPEVKDADCTTFLERCQTEAKCFREKNQSLFAREEILKGKYLALVRGTTFHFGGKKRTMTQIRFMGMDSDSSVRSAAWDIYREGMKKRTGSYDRLLDQLVAIRTQLAKNAGFEDYVAYTYCRKARSYSPDDIQPFRQAVREYIVPISCRLAERNAQLLGIDAFGCENIDYDPLAENLRPYSNETDLKRKVIGVFTSINQSYGALVEKMAGLGSLSLGARKGKFNVGFTMPVRKEDKVYVSLNIPFDKPARHEYILGLHHELGHLIHFSKAPSVSLPEYWNQWFMPGEVMELASIATELCAMRFYHFYYQDPKEVARGKLRLLRRAIDLLCNIAMVDEYETEIYRREFLTTEDKDQFYRELLEQYFPWIDMDKAGKDVALRRHFYPHPYQLPLYFIEYAFPLLGGIHFIPKLENDWESAIASLDKVLALGASQKPKQLYEMLGLPFGCSEEIVAQAAIILSKRVSDCEI